MNKLLTSAALLGAMAISSAATAEDAAAPAKVKCFGIAAAGKNDCKSADGANSCAGASTRDKNPADWRYATAEECAKEGGKADAAEVKM